VTLDRRSVALAAVCGVLFLTFLDNTIVSVALASLQGSLGIGVSGLQWVVDGYMLAFAALMLTGGTLGDLLGRKRVMLAGLVIFCAGSLLAALATTTGVLIAGRVVMGVGAAASEPGTLSLIRQMYPEQGPRARALGVWTAVSGIALSLGPIAGGVLVAAFGWRGVFWFNLAFGLAAFAVAWATVPESSDPQGRHLDLAGLAITVVGLSAATFGVIEGEANGYTTWWIVLLLVVAVVAVAAFLLVEGRVRDPLVRLELLRTPAFAIANAVAFVTNFALFAVFFFTALYLQLVAGFSGWQIALQFLSLAAAMAAAGVAAGRWTAVAGPRAPMVAGCLVAGCGMLLVDVLLTPHASIAPLAGALALVGLGFGAALVTVTATVLALVPPERSGTAASTLNTSRQLGGVLGVAVLGAIVDSKLTSSLDARLAQIGIPKGFRGFIVSAVERGQAPNDPSKVTNPAARGHEALVTKVIAAAESAFGSGLHACLALAAAMLLAAGVLAYFSSARISFAARTPSVAPPSMKP
jgi:EmrB/QacA subfamily drug resistance transporter